MRATTGNLYCCGSLPHVLSQVCNSSCLGARPELVPNVPFCMLHPSPHLHVHVRFVQLPLGAGLDDLGHHQWVGLVAHAENVVGCDQAKAAVCGL